MSKESLIKAQKYADDIKNRLQSSTPEKHRDSPQTYKLFLTRELEAVTRKIESLKLVSDKK